MAEERYVKPGWFTRHIFNPVVQGLTKLGISVWGSREYEQWRALLHHFYDPFPVVEHYSRVLAA